MSRAGSPLFLGWVAFCSAVCVGVATGQTWDESAAVRIGAALLGLAIALVVAFASLAIVAWVRSEPKAKPEEPVEAPAPVVVPAAPAPADDLRAQLEALRAAGLELRGAPPDEARVEEWLGQTGRLLDAELPGVAGYFRALPASSWPAQLARLETILRDVVSE